VRIFSPNVKNGRNTKASVKEPSLNLTWNLDVQKVAVHAVSDVIAAMLDYLDYLFCYNIQHGRHDFAILFP
jgi:hypothetical protein